MDINVALSPCITAAYAKAPYGEADCGPKSNSASGYVVVDGLTGYMYNEAQIRGYPSYPECPGCNSGVAVSATGIIYEVVPVVAPATLVVDSSAGSSALGNIAAGSPRIASLSVLLATASAGIYDVSSSVLIDTPNGGKVKGLTYGVNPVSGFTEWHGTRSLSLPTGINGVDIDFNNDGSVFDPDDIAAFLSVFAEGPCVPSSATCDTVDVNCDGSLFDPADLELFVDAYLEAPNGHC